MLRLYPKCCILFMSMYFFIKLSKCIFYTSMMDYLGHYVSNGELMTDPSKFKVIKKLIDIDLRD